jgi:large subunit ribosomal protein L6
VLLSIPDGVTVKTPISTRIVLSGTNYHKITQFAAKIRSYRKPEPYNGKGIFVGNETITLKEGKKK